MKLAWAVSGGGRAAQAVMEAHEAGLLCSKLDFVIFDRTEGTAAMRAYCTKRKIEFQVVTPGFLDQKMIMIQQSRALSSMGLTFNRLISESVIEAFGGRIFNLHLSLLPSLPGFGATRAALSAGLPYTGVTVHFIDAGIDSGPIIAQRKVPIINSDDEVSLGRRQFEAAVPLVLQTVRLMEKCKNPKFEYVDDDLQQFSREICPLL